MDVLVNGENENLSSCNNGILRDSVSSEYPSFHLDVDAEGNNKKWLRSNRKHSADLRCHECDYSTSDRSSLYTHIRGHTDDRPFKCLYCPYASKSESILVVHTKSHTLEAPSLNNLLPLTVEQPTEKLPTSQPNTAKSELQNNKVAVKGESKGNDEDASSAKIDSSAGVEKPLQNAVRIEVSVSKKFRCDYAGCAYSTNAPISFKNHLNVHLNEKVFKCKICLKFFLRSDHCLSHEKLHVKKISQLCEHKIGTDSSKCKKYRKELVFRCLWCPFTCERENQLVIHCRSPHRFKRFHGTRIDDTATEPPLAPDIHIKRDDDQEIMEPNENGHLRDADFCFTNDYVEFPNKMEASVTNEVLFVQPASVDTEGNIVTEVMPSDTTNGFLPYGANEVSSFTTVTTTNYSATPVTRTTNKKEPSSDVKPRKFKCNRSGCSFSSSYSKNLILHRLLIHSMNNMKRPFQCKQCSKRFVRSTGLRVHERSHIHGFLHRCDECDYGTQYKCNLKTHVQNKHGG